MRFRYKDSKGKVVTLPSVAALVLAVRSGEVTDETQLSSGTRRWERAEKVTAYRQAVAALKLDNPQAASTPVAEATQSAKPRSRLRMLVPGLIAATLVAGVLYKKLGQAAPPPRAKAVDPGPGPHASARLYSYSFQFADSVALEIRALQDWITARKLDATFRGAGLKRVASLRAARAVAAELLRRVDSLEQRSAELARRVTARADSLAVSDNGLAGLTTALEAELHSWSKDFTAHHEILRQEALTIDTLSAFLLEKQNSFTIWDGQAAFLSSGDGMRFAELKQELANLSHRELNWSESLFRRRPDWMAGVLEDERPRFGASVIAAR